MIGNQKILFKFIQNNDNVNWYFISRNYILSENFIREFKDEVDWYYISKYQILSKKFKKEFKYKNIW